MANFVTIAEVRQIATARVLITALKAHGFSPLEGGEAGLPGMPGIKGATGLIAIQVPQDQASNAQPLAEDLLKDMRD